MTGDFESQVAGVAILHEPVRRALYLVVARSAEPVSRDRAATAVGVQRTLAAFHLDKLVDEGLLAVEFRRLTGRTGPGAGRPAKLYRRSDRQLDVTLPPREYDVAAHLMAGAIDAADAHDRPVRAQLTEEAAAFGQSIGEEAVARAGRGASEAAQRAALVEVLASHGFEARQVDDDIVLANCPFDALAREFTELVCGMNLDVMRGARGALTLSDDELQPRLEPEAGRCCVRFCTRPA